MSLRIGQLTLGCPLIFYTFSLLNVFTPYIPPASSPRHDLFTNDVLYMDAALDLTRVPARLLPLVPLFCRWVARWNDSGAVKDRGSISSTLLFFFSDGFLLPPRFFSIPTPSRLGHPLSLRQKSIPQTPHQLPNHRNQTYTTDSSDRPPKRCLTNTGTAKESFTELTERIGRKTGGISATHFTSAVRGKKEPVSYVMLKGKAMKDR